MTLNAKPVILLRKMAETVPFVTPWLDQLSEDSKQFDKRGRGISASSLYQLIYFREPKPGGRVDQILIKLLQSLKQKSPLADGKKEGRKISG